jgi:hypothetical protein
MFVFGNDLLSETGATSVPYLDSPLEEKPLITAKQQKP